MDDVQTVADPVLAHAWYHEFQDPEAGKDYEIFESRDDACSTCIAVAIVPLSDYESLAERLRELEGDAARYRWLRQGDNDEAVLRTAYPTGKHRAFDPSRDLTFLPRRDKLDAAIDSAMQQDGGGREEDD